MTARKELEKFQAMYHQNLSSIKASEELNNILSKQRSPWLKSGLGYEKVQVANSQNANILCKHKEMKQVPESEIQIRIINQGLLKNIVNKREDHQDSGTKFFSMVTVIVVLILTTKLQTVHLILEICNQRTINCYNIEQDS